MISELGKIAEFEDSADELNLKTDRVIGKMTEDLMRLYTLLWRARREAISARTKMSERLEDEWSVAWEAHAAFERVDVITRLFINATREEYDLWKDGCPAIGVRKGFLLVVSRTGKKQSYDRQPVIQVIIQGVSSGAPGLSGNN